MYKLSLTHARLKKKPKTNKHLYNRYEKNRKAILKQWNTSISWKMLSNVVNLKMAFSINIFEKFLYQINTPTNLRID